MSKLLERPNLKPHAKELAKFKPYSESVWMKVDMLMVRGTTIFKVEPKLLTIKRGKATGTIDNYGRVEWK